MYDVLVLIHVLSAMVWVGGGFVLFANEQHAHRVGGSSALHRVLRQTEWADNWIFTPAPLLVIITGVTMVSINEAWAFSQPWVYLALALIVAEFTFGFRDYNRVKAALDKGGESPEFRTAAPAYMRFARVAMVILGTVVLLMVFKPGA